MRLFSDSIRFRLGALAFAAFACAGAWSADGSVSLTGAPSAPASESAPLSAEEAHLVGSWLEGLSAQARQQLAAMPPERAAAMRQMLGDTLVFRADHTMTIYPRCAQRAAYGKAGEQGLAARWHIDGRKLRVTAEQNGRPIDRSTPFKLDGDELTFFENMAVRPQVMGRYDSPLPPRCD
jgi:hypothetical protein